VACLTECDSEALIMRRPWPTTGCCTKEKQIAFMKHLYDKASCGVHSFYCFHLWYIQLDVTNSSGSDFKFGSAYILTP
jgi:hypothetical protein